MMNEVETAPEGVRRMLDVDQVLSVVPVSRMTLFRMERDGRFPPSVYISANRRAWYADEIAAWQKSLPENGRIARRRVRQSRQTAQ